MLILNTFFERFLPLLTWTCKAMQIYNSIKYLCRLCGITCLSVTGASAISAEARAWDEHQVSPAVHSPAKRSVLPSLTKPEASRIVWQYSHPEKSWDSLDFQVNRVISWECRRFSLHWALMELRSYNSRGGWTYASSHKEWQKNDYEKNMIKGIEVFV